MGQSSVIDLMSVRYEKDPSVVYREIAGEAILVPIYHDVVDMEAIYTLDEVGARVWDLLDGQRTVAEIQGLILDEYDVRPDVLSVDLAEFFEQLLFVGAVRAA
jgi:hypothetical protein